MLLALQAINGLFAQNTMQELSFEVVNERTGIPLDNAQIAIDP